MEDTILNLFYRRKLETKHLQRQKFKDETKEQKINNDQKNFKISVFNKRELTESEKTYIKEEFEPNDFEKRILNLKKPL